MTRRGTDGCVFQSAFQSAELPNGSIQFGRLVRKEHAVDLRRRPVTKHRTDLIERKSCHAAERDQREPAENILIVSAPEAATSQRLDQAFLFVEAQGRGRDS